MNDNIKIIFIGGTGRNGSTILGKIFDTAEGVTNIGEASRFSLSKRMQNLNILCECGNSIDKCNFWKNKNIINTNLLDDNYTNLLKLRNAHKLIFFKRNKNIHKIQKHIFNFFMKINTNNDIYFDTSKHPSYSLIYNSINEFDVTFIHMVRSPYQFVYSQTKKKEYLLGKMSIFRASLQWLTYNLFYEIFRYFNKNKCTRIFYEDFVRNPNKVFKNIQKFNPDLNIIKLFKFNDKKQIQLKIGHSLAGNPDKFSDKTIKIENKKHKISKFHKIYIFLICFPLIFFYGRKYIFKK